MEVRYGTNNRLGDTISPDYDQKREYIPFYLVGFLQSTSFHVAFFKKRKTKNKNKNKKQKSQLRQSQYQESQSLDGRINALK